ncbi:hypothetical protein T492DRAFT_918324, partial [Pavlovales sp. CCMP2436]
MTRRPSTTTKPSDPALGSSMNTHFPSSIALSFLREYLSRISGGGIHCPPPSARSAGAAAVQGGLLSSAVLPSREVKAENSEIFGSVLRQNPGSMPGSMRTEEALLRARAATVDAYVELDQPDGQAAVGHIVEMKTVHYGLTHYNAVAPTRGHA